MSQVGTVRSGNVRYGIGSATGIAAAEAVALVAAPPSSATVGLLAAALEEQLSMVAVLSQLMATDPELLPSFMVARIEPAGVRIVLRGDLAVAIHTSGGTEIFNAKGLSTWREAVFADVIGISAGAEASDELPFSLSVGTFPVGQLSWTLTSAVLPSIAPPAPAIQPPITHSPNPSVEPHPGPPKVPDPSRVEPIATAGARSTNIDDLDFTHLVDRTVYRQVEDAAVRAEPAIVDVEHPAAVGAREHPGSPLPPAGAGETILAAPGSPELAHPSPNHVADQPQQGDHDGHTVMRKSSANQAVVPVLSPGGPQVLAVRCPQGHPNPPQAPDCRVCRQGIVNRATEQILRPNLGVLRFSTGLVVPVHGPLAIGRRPPNDQLIGSEVAAAVVIDDSELSRLHVSLAVNDWYVQVIDQGSLNGTMVSTPGHADQVLRPNERVQITHGCTINLGGAVTATFDVV